ncbi:hypothetical protein QBC41DRAFT_57777 [Cercophora samala]|uniref:Uncharacterized protein n=1 Tax=Cercophora samala TaxID=330535 RepID=A0AA40CXT2_9PEZI|nr:hypothetical protein QBC41DRAFT_57777 [Cercophora samala]
MVVTVFFPSVWVLLAWRWGFGIHKNGVWDYRRTDWAKVWGGCFYSLSLSHFFSSFGRQDLIDSKRYPFCDFEEKKRTEDRYPGRRGCYLRGAFVGIYRERSTKKKERKNRSEIGGWGVYGQHLRHHNSTSATQGFRIGLFLVPPSPGREREKSGR